jgi:hypothetical protein
LAHDHSQTLSGRSEQGIGLAKAANYCEANLSQ